MLCTVLTLFILYSCGTAFGESQGDCMLGPSAGCAIATGLQEFMLWWLPVGSIRVSADPESHTEATIGLWEASGAFLLYSPLHGSKHGKVCVLQS